MTALRGLREAAALLIVAAVLAAAAALVWTMVGDGRYLDRFGYSLIVFGVIASVTGGVAWGRGATADPLAFLGSGPERDVADRSGGKVLTGVGIFLFVGVPLVILGVILAS